MASYLKDLKAGPVVRVFRSKSDATAVEPMEEVIYESWKSLMATISNSSRESLLKTISADPIQATFTNFGTGPDGLTEVEAAERLKIAGLNRLDTKKAIPWWLLLLSVLPNPFNVLLVLIAIISVATPPPSWATFVLLMVMIVLAVVVRFWQEWKGTVEAIKLQSSVVTEIEVHRRPLEAASVSKHVDLGELVPGDVITLNPGDNVPADCMLLHTAYLQVAQSSLTGESEPVNKTSKARGEKDDLEAIFDIQNLVFMGTVVVSGSATALVLETGNNTIIASVTKGLNKKRPSSAFEIGIRRVTYLMITMMLIMVSVVLVIQGELSHNWASASLFALSVAVGIVPEMLPAIINVNLARGAYVLSKKRAIVRRLDAVQNLGGMTVLCSDKTGTLTRDEIRLSRAENTQGAVDAHVLRLAYTNATYQSGKKNSIDAAIIQQCETVEKIEPLGECVAEMPFNFEKRRCSTVIRKSDGGLEFICKGAFEEVLGLCSRIRVGDKVVRLTDEESKRLYKKAHAFNEDGLRVLAVCTKELVELDVDDPDWIVMAESSVILEGLLTFLDPPKEDAADAIACLRDQGVEVKVLTGDSLRIAAKVCRTLHLTGPYIESGIQSISGPELAKLNGDKFHEAVKRCTIFAKLTPNQKGEVITSLKSSGQCVGMLGDGINDCLALRIADVGISVNTAVNVAKDCANVILTQKELSIIVDGVKVGRLTYGNTIKYCKMVMSSNFGNVFSVLIASAWLPYQPMQPIQIIIQNILYDISQMTLPWDGMDAEYLARPKQWNIWDLARFCIVFGPTSSTIDMMTFCLNWFYYGIRTADSPLVPRAHTHWFLEGLLTQTLIVHMLRTAKVPFFQSWAARPLIFTTSTIMVIGLVLPYLKPIAKLLGLVWPANSFLGFLAVELLIYCLEVQFVKVVYIKIFKVWL